MENEFFNLNGRRLLKAETLSECLPSTFIAYIAQFRRIPYRSKMITGQPDDLTLLKAIDSRIAKMREVHDRISDIDHAHARRHRLSDLLRFFQDLSVCLFHGVKKGICR